MCTAHFFPLTCFVSWFFQGPQNQDHMWLMVVSLSSKCISWFFHLFFLHFSDWRTLPGYLSLGFYVCISSSDDDNIPNCDSSSVQQVHSCEYLALVIAQTCFICYFLFCTKLVWVKIEFCGCTDVNSFLKESSGRK